jgi:DNA-binding CsgD family transcriptional regulator
MRPVSGWGSLTAGERRVALAVGEGLTNVQAADRLCLSRYTVDFHLRQTFRKLDIRSRVELARLSALETETVPPQSLGAMSEVLDT